MTGDNRWKYFLVRSDMLPDIFLHVIGVKELLETGEASTVAEAVAKMGISRSAYYKYRDAVAPFRDMKSGLIITFSVILRDRPGVLSSVLGVFAGSGANILTINQSIPVNGTAAVTISAGTENMPLGTEDLMAKLEATDGVIKIEIVAG